MASINPIYQVLVPVGMNSIGVYLQSRDKNTTGSDDAWGRMLVAMSPGVTAALDGTQSVKVEERVMTAVRDVAQARLDELQAAKPAKSE